jgi:hypothetical protein
MRSTRCCMASTRHQKRRRSSPTLSRTAVLAPPCTSPSGAGGAGSTFFWVPPPLVAGRPVAPSTAPRPTEPRCYAAPSPSHGALQSAPARRRLAPLHRTVPWSTGSQPPAPRWPASSRVAPRRQTPAAPRERADSGVPRARGARQAATARPGAATSRQTSAAPWSRHRRSTAPSPPSSAPPGRLCRGAAAQPASPLLAPRRPCRRRGPALPPPPAAAAQRHRRSRLSPTRRAPPHRRPAGACDAPGAGAGHKAARLVPQRAGHAPGRLSLLVVERGRGQARRGRPHARTPATPQCGHAPPGLLCPSTDAPPPPPAGPFCATRFPRGPAPRVDRL